MEEENWVCALVLPFCPKQCINATAFSRGSCEGCSLIFFSPFPFLFFHPIINQPSRFTSFGHLPIMDEFDVIKFFYNQVFTAFVTVFSVFKRGGSSFVPNTHRGPHNSTNHWNICHPSCYWVPIEQYRDNTLSEKLRVCLLFLAQVCILFGVTMARDFVLWCCPHAFSVDCCCSVVICRGGAEGEKRERGKTCCKQF